MARSTTPAGYAEDLRRSLRPIKKAATQARILGHNPEYMREARDVAAQNEQAVFATRGQSMGYPFSNRRDYVDTGRMRRELTTPGLLRSRVYADRIAFSARVKYFRVWSRNVIGWGKRWTTMLAVRSAKYLKGVAEGDR